MTDTETVIVVGMGSFSCHDLGALLNGGKKKSFECSTDYIRRERNVSDLKFH